MNINFKLSYIKIHGINCTKPVGSIKLHVFFSSCWVFRLTARDGASIKILFMSVWSAYCHIYYLFFIHVHSSL